jgi:hypothetical protein
MKKLLVIISFFAPTSFIWSQWTTSGTNIFNTNTGNVGIGTTTPGVPLEIRKDQNSETVVNITNNFAGLNAIARYQLTTATPNSYALHQLQNSSGAPSYLFATGPAVTASFYRSPEFYFQNSTGASTIFKVNTATGFVTVGNITSTPGAYKLYVETGILTEKVKIALKSGVNWADYVFEPKYKLKPLAELATFIKQNKHLPGIPSAEDIVKDGGIDVNQMFAKQMEKIEELTLHLIEMNKRLNLLEKENKNLKILVSK